LSAPNIVGRYILENGKKNPFVEGKLFDLADSKDLWEKRISILATFYFIRNGRFAETLQISKILLKDKHDLIHKAVGWMLREIWKRDNKVAEDFIKENYKEMPRTTLKYAIERMKDGKRKKFLSMSII
jgi:3-methyladenine DNA glycosylase AlkD